MRGKIRYQKELQKTYMIAEECDRELLENYCGQTILRTKIRGLAACEMHLMDGRREIWYDISFLQSLEQAFAVKEMSYHDLRNLLLQIVQTVTEMEKYLLDGGQLCFDSENVYWNMETGRAVFLFDLTEEKTESGLVALGEFILERVCHEEEKAVDLAYFFYECSTKESFSVKEVEQYLEGQKTETGYEKLTQQVEIQKTDETGKINKADAGKIKDNIQIGEKEQAEDRIRPEKEAYETEFWEMMQQAGKKEEGRSDRSKERQERNRLQSVCDWFYNGTGGKVTEAGLACIVTALLAGGGCFIFQKYFCLEDWEKWIWMGGSVFLLISGMLILPYGLAVRKRENKTGEKTDRRLVDRKRQWDKNEYDYAESENGFRQWQETDPAGCGEEAEKKTIYIGKALLSREYSLSEIKKGTEKEHPIPSYPFLIGKDKERVNLYIKEHSVSRIHARLLEEDGDIYIEDLHSTNGTYLNDLPLQPHDKVRIKRGDIVLFGAAEFVFR